MAATAVKTNREAKAIAEGMFNYWRSMLNLNHWQIKLRFDLTDKQKEQIRAEDENATEFYVTWGWCLTPFAGEYAEIFINPQALFLPEVELELVIVHELNHCHMHQIDEMVENVFATQIKHKPTYELVWEKEYERHAEILVDRHAMNYVGMRRALCPDIHWLEFANA
jgi:hypothetical protein